METLKKIKKFINKRKYYIMGALGGACLIGGVYLYLKGATINGTQTVQTSLSQFVDTIKKGNITNIQIQGDQATFETAGNICTTSLQGLSRQFVIGLLMNNGILKFNILQQPQLLTPDVINALTVIASMCFTFYMFKGNLFSKKISTTNKMPQNQILFKDIYGHFEVKQKLRQIIDFMHNPQKYKSLGARMRKGILLYGPPGTGKTMIAKAMAFEAGVDFIYTSASQFIQIFVGVGPKRIRQIFQQAREKQKGCIIFIDEFDAIGSRSQIALNQDTQRNSTINQLLTQMDGFSSTTNIVVIGATNRQNMIDPAILRPGRLDIKIKVNLPTLQQRQGILNIHLQKKQNTITQQQVNYLAQNTQGSSGADLEQIINQATYVCLRKKEHILNFDHLTQAFNQIAHGKCI